MQKKPRCVFSGASHFEAPNRKHAAPSAMSVARLFRGTCRAVTRDADRIPRYRSGEQGMTTRMLSALALVLLLPCAAALSPQAQAQGYPAKAVRVVVPLPAGGATDGI